MKATLNGPRRTIRSHYVLSRHMKRAFDICVAAIALICLTPVFLSVYVLIRRRMGSPVLFRQQRPGLHGQPFTFYKFRTMTDARDDNGRLLPDEYRLTRPGKFLRRTSIDELPQLWNVLKGDMSIVGPRPLLMEYLPLYTPEQARRHDVRPGLVGWAVVHGRNSCSWEDKFALDVWYVDNHSLWLDLKIIARAVSIVFTGTGVSQEGCATALPFTGSPGLSDQR